MQLASNTHRSAYLEESPSIRAALELLSDKEPTEQQGTLIDVDAERKAREEAERQVAAENPLFAVRPNRKFKIWPIVMNVLCC